MKIFLILAALVIFVIVCDRYEKRLPPPISWIYAVWKKFSHAFGRMMSWLILTILWLVGFGAYAIVRKCAGIFRSKPTTGWHVLPPEPSESIMQPY